MLLYGLCTSVSHGYQLLKVIPQQIYRLLIEGLSLQEIAIKVGLHKSTPYRELERYSPKLGYRPDFSSQQDLMCRHSNELKIDRYPNLKTYIVETLEEGWSPEQISGRLRHERGRQLISHEAIYQYIYSPTGKSLKLHKYLPRSLAIDALGVIFQGHSPLMNRFPPVDARQPGLVLA